MFLDAFSQWNAIVGLMMLVVPVVFVAAVAIIVVAVSRNAARARQAGRDPLTLQTDLAVQALDSRMLAPEQSLEQRLAELDDLARRGVISSDERAAARADLLAGR